MALIITLNFLDWIENNFVIKIEKFGKNYFSRNRFLLFIFLEYKINFTLMLYFLYCEIFLENFFIGIIYSLNVLIYLFNLILRARNFPIKGDLIKFKFKKRFSLRDDKNENAIVLENDVLSSEINCLIGGKAKRSINIRVFNIKILKNKKSNEI